LKATELKLAISNAYFDTGDYSDPVNYYLDDELRWRLLPGYKLSKYIQLQHNEADVYDSAFPFVSATEYEFFTADKVIEKIEYDDLTASADEVFEIRFRLDSINHNYERRVFSLSDMMGLIGGVFEVLLVTGSFLVGFISRKMFSAAILNKLYCVDDINQETECQMDSRAMPD
jgi:hypothetical protein